MQEAARMTEEQIKETVLGLIKGRYFRASEAPSEMWASIFLPVLGGL